MRIKDSVVVITGGSSGIGRATGLAFARRGARVVLAARDATGLDSAARECEAFGVQALAVVTDVRDETAVRALADAALAHFGRIDVWVNNAAVTAFGPFDEMPIEDVQEVLDVNVMGYMNGARVALPIMRAQGRGTLINVSSLVSATAQPYAHAYAMSKSAARALSASLRQELRVTGVKGVHVCTVLPPTVDTPLFQHAANYTGRTVRAMPPVHTAERVARVIVNLARVPRREVAVGTMAKFLIVQSHLAPGLTERQMGRRVHRKHFIDEPAAASRGTLDVGQQGHGAVDGGWGGRRHTAVRRAMAVAASAALLTLAGRRALRHG